ncbi:hypothetical protein YASMINEVIRUS_684 [Yasminevirus sp. GU-2018]|uniref:Glycosyltransferase family 25 n=1 Tax=Yasminevirus sp. GU-2018 TaxID=2420051 RepID=A0A5K0U9H5_9VIRU|nr:hypothetical protein YASMINEVIRUS_684 [Yasminevirus sp. GU-2018]
MNQKIVSQINVPIYRVDLTNNKTDRLNSFVQTLNKISVSSDRQTIGVDLNYPKVAIIMDTNHCFECYLNQPYSVTELVDVIPEYDLFHLSYFSDYKPEYVIKLLSSGDLVTDLMIDSVCDLTEKLLEYKPLCFAVTHSGANKLLNSLNNNAHNAHDLHVSSCVVNRPYFSATSLDTHRDSTNTTLIKTKQIADNFYDLLSVWDRVYCINLAFDTLKYFRMLRVCRMFNKRPDKFFFGGLSSDTLPLNNTELTNDTPKVKTKFDPLIRAGLVSPEINNEKHERTIGEISLGLTQLAVLADADENQYRKILILEDDVIIEDAWFIWLTHRLQYLSLSDIFYLGCTQIGSYSDYHSTLDRFFNKVDDDTQMNKNKSVLYERNDVVADCDCSIAGAFAISLSKRSVKVIRSLFTKIDTIGDILFFSIVLGQIRNFSTGLDSHSKLTLADGDALKSYIALPNIINADVSKLSIVGNDISKVKRYSTEEHKTFFARLRVESQKYFEHRFLDNSSDGVGRKILCTYDSENNNDFFIGECVDGTSHKAFYDLVVSFDKRVLVGLVCQDPLSIAQIVIKCVSDYLTVSDTIDVHVCTGEEMNKFTSEPDQLNPTRRFTECELSTSERFVNYCKIEKQYNYNRYLNLKHVNCSKSRLDKTHRVSNSRSFVVLLRLLVVKTLHALKYLLEVFYDEMMSRFKMR